MLVHCFNIFSHFAVVMDIGLNRLLIGVYHLPSLQEIVMQLPLQK
jgi:hypothetical protein